jgi:tripartite-type tricarboxylate transporter receptor subunit TctC
MNNRCKLIFVAWAASTMTAATAGIPERPVRFIVRSAPGGASDVSSRIVVAEFTRQVGQQFVANNRPGASGSIETNLIARAVLAGQEVLQTPAIFRQWLVEWTSKS